MEWTQRLTEPIALDNGEVLRTLRDARKFILALPEQHQGYVKWQSLARLLLIAAQIFDPDVIAIATEQLRQALRTEPFAPGVRLVDDTLPPSSAPSVKRRRSSKLRRIK